jgi:hypothetical protein
LATRQLFLQHSVLLVKAALTLHRYVAVTPLRKAEVRLVLAPSVSNPEFHRAGTLKQLRHLGLVEACED